MDDTVIDLTASQPPQEADSTLATHSIMIEGINVVFPFKPYSVQEVYMSKVIKTLKQGSVAALESPTGTGKTLSLLCSTLAWVEKEKEMSRGPMRLEEPQDDHAEDWLGGRFCRKVVFYASRTHSQLSKAMAELRRTPYRHVRATIVASRDQLCIHPDLPVEESLHTKNAFCQAHVSAKTCRFHTRVESAKSDRSFFQVRDIEDLVAKSKKTGCCPFYLTRHLQEEAEVIFLPYDYIFDRSIRRRLNLNFNNAIVILDEGHNIEGKCEEAASVDLSSTDIAVAIRDVTEEMQRIHDELNDPEWEMVERPYSTEDLMFMKEKLIALEAAFDEFMKSLKESSREFKPDTLKSLLEQATITEEVYSRLESGLGAVYDIVVAQNSINLRTRQQACTLRKVADFISAPYQLDAFSPKNLNSFVVHAELVFEATKRNNFGTPLFNAMDRSKAKGVKFDLWCLNPSVGMHPLHNVHALILTSGTLSPLKNVILELGLRNFEAVHKGAELQTAELGHVVPLDQFMIFALGKGPNNVQLQSGYTNRDNLTYWEELGFTLQNFIRLIPDGVLVFFSSYGALNKAINTWKFKGLWDRLNAIKPLFSEETDKRRFNMAVEGYRTAVDSKKGGVLMGVCRGKMSEGIDFSDQYGRAVVICGLPYASFVNPRVKCKMRYIDSLGIKELRGDDWYRNDATKAVNQATGRVIRHANDIGVILLCDAKFEQPGIQSAMSAWLKPVRTMRSFGEAVSALRCFFRKHPHLFKREAVVSTPASLPPPVVDLTSSPSSSKSSGPISCNLPARPLEKPAKSSCLEILADEDNNCDVVTKKLPPKSPIKSWRQVVQDVRNVEITGPAKKRSIRRTPFIPNRVRCEPDTPENREKTRQMNESKFLLHEIKRTLDEESYQIFFNLLKLYQKDKNLAEYIGKLSVFFPKEDQLLADYFRDCHKFLTGEHKKCFIDHCAANGYGVVLSSSRILEEPPEP